MWALPRLLLSRHRVLLWFIVYILCLVFFLPCDHSFVFGLLKWNRGTVYIYELVVFKRELIKECLKNIE